MMDFIWLLREPQRKRNDDKSSDMPQSGLFADIQTTEEVQKPID
jgi:hypothetical protein